MKEKQKERNIRKRERKERGKKTENNGRETERKRNRWTERERETEENVTGKTNKQVDNDNVSRDVNVRETMRNIQRP